MAKILIAEDEKPMAKALVMKLKKEGFEAEAVHDGESAVEAIKTGKYDLALLDLVMPKLDGFGVLERIKKEKVKAKIIVASNLGQESDIKRAKDLGAVDYFIKSDTPLVKIIEKVKGFLG